ncbi:hypothetical protein B9Z55_020918 [Caenorhabditis nigoni]|uniref:DDE-1 domain-containing protein n=1 Tax=Caenorhabditis nigoni TaxID=1611254 RepID=A0A2G5TQJ5_9PELO|nr:hypothetical protein B9Z55_020918 [Caenorhabditis nigoni]
MDDLWNKLYKSGHMRAPPMDVYLQWIVDAWKSLPGELIKKSFKGCALTTSPGGSEDHLIHCFKTNSEVPSVGCIEKSTHETIIGGIGRSDRKCRPHSQ